MVDPVHRHLSVAVFNDAADASAAGYDYKDGTKPIEVVKVVVVRNGTVGGNPTVDFVLQDECGIRYAFMVTGALLKSIPC